jgi:N-methylhydantoinase B
LILAGFGGAGTPNESLEMEYPVIVERVAMWTDSGGPGRWRGGVGSIRDIRMLEGGMLTARIADRSIFPPRGILGGSAGTGGAWIINRGTPVEVVLPPKVTNYPIRSGDLVTMAGSGGGGVGNPLQREPADVLRDVREGRVSVAAARARYGVAVLATPGDEAVAALDEAETRRLREVMQ